MRKRDIGLRAATVISMIALFAAPSSAADFDTDYNNDGAITAADAAIILAALGTTEDDDHYNPSLDHDGDGQILTSDYEIFLNSYPGD